MTITEAGKPASEHCLDSYLLGTKDITNPLPTLKVGGQQQRSPGITVLPWCAVWMGQWSAYQ